MNPFDSLFDAATAKLATGEKFTDADITAEVAEGVAMWLKDYTGMFDYVLDIRAQAARKRGYISTGQARGLANCYLADRRKVAAKVADAAYPELFPRIAEIFANVTGIKYPKVRLQTASGFEIVLKVLGPMSKTPGAISIVSREKLDTDQYGEPKQRWFGTILVDGTLRRSAKLTTEIVDVLIALNADPAGVASVYGKATGNCCFCGKYIETKESMAVGYGPVCADNYGLPWGLEVAAN